MTNQRPIHGHVPYGRETRHAAIRRRRADQARGRSSVQIESPLEWRGGKLCVQKIRGLTTFESPQTPAETAYNQLVLRLRQAGLAE